MAVKRAQQSPGSPCKIKNERRSFASREFTVTHIKSSKNTQNQNQTNKYVLYHFKVGGIEEHSGQEGSRYQSIRFLNIFSCKCAKIESDIYILGVKRRRIILTHRTHLNLKAYT